MQELTDIYFDNEEKLDKTAVDKAFEKVLNQRNDIYFRHYYSRLEKTFENENEYKFALTVLKILTQQDSLSKLEISNLPLKLGNYSYVLRILEFDGYIFSSQEGTNYQFISPLLKLWWKHYVF